MENLMLQQIHLRNLQIIQNNPSARKNNQPPNSNRTLMKLYLTRETLEECLQTLDIFKEILEDTVQKNKLIRDVNKNLQLKIYDQGAIIYDKGDVSSGFYMVIKGKVSLCLPIFKSQLSQSMDERNQTIVQEQQIDTFGEGIGFGQAEFIHGRKRAVVAKAKSDGTVVGIIEGNAFQEIIELYKQRVYYKKIQMFGRCPLLKNLLPYQLQFIVNNAKPITIPISKQIIKQGQRPKALYLITQGQVELKRSNQLLKRSQSKYRLNQKDRIQDVLLQKIKIKSTIVGALQQGQFIGDGEIAMNISYNFSVYAKSQKVRLYCCDERIIISQMTEKLFDSALLYYKDKLEYHQNKSSIYKEVKSKIQKTMQNKQICLLNQKQLKMKRMIFDRYVQKVPTIIGKLSPRELSKLVDKKYARMKSQPSRYKQGELPQLSTKTAVKILKANERSYSPLLKKSQIKHERKLTQLQQQGMLNKASQSISCNQNYVSQVLSNPYQFQRSSSKPLLLFMKPYTNKLLSLHQRLSNQYSKHMRKEKKLKCIGNQSHDNYSIIEMRRVYEFVNKIRSNNQNN